MTRPLPSYVPVSPRLPDGSGGNAQPSLRAASAEGAWRKLCAALGTSLRGELARAGWTVAQTVGAT